MCVHVCVGRWFFSWGSHYTLSRVLSSRKASWIYSNIHSLTWLPSPHTTAQCLMCIFSCTLSARVLWLQIRFIDKHRKVKMEPLKGHFGTAVVEGTGGGLELLFKLKSKKNIGRESQVFCFFVFLFTPSFTLYSVWTQRRCRSFMPSIKFLKC